MMRWLLCLALGCGTAARLEAGSDDRPAAAGKPAPAAKMSPREARKKLPRYGTRQLTEEQVEAILECLKDNNEYWRGQAVNHIQEADVVEAHRAEIARGLHDALAGSNVGVQIQAAKALGRWGTKESAGKLIQFLEAAGDNGARNAAVEALGKLKDERAIETVVDHLPNPAVRAKASWALKSFGAAAETKVAAALTHKNRDVRREACAILKVIGTARSLPPLRAAIGDEFKPVADAAADAIRQIQRRK